MSKSDAGLSEPDESFVDVIAAIVACSESSKAVKPTQSALRNPAEHTQAAAVFGVPFGQVRFDVAFREFFAVRLRIAGPVFSPPPKARTDALSTATLEKSSSSADRNLFSNTSASLSQTPASCQSRIPNLTESRIH